MTPEVELREELRGHGVSLSYLQVLTVQSIIERKTEELEAENRKLKRIVKSLMDKK